jgi:hypothetical protein
MDRYNCEWPLMLAPKDAPKWAITLGQTTYYTVSKEHVDPAWRRHEAEHKKQWRREGWKFPFKYLWYQFRYGYQKNPYEVCANEVM